MGKVIKSLLSPIVVAAALLLTAALLIEIAVLPSGRTQMQATGKVGIIEKFRMETENNISNASGSLALKKKYWIAEDALSAPKPNQKCYGEVDTPEKMKNVLEQAQDLLDGQTMFFSTKRTLQEGTTIHYYLDETIFAVTWKEKINGSAITFSEVKIAHASQFRRFLSDGTFGSGKLYLTSEMAKSTNAVVAASGDYYAYRPMGVVVTNGVVNRVNNGLSDICYIDVNGDMHMVRNKANVTQESIQNYVSGNEISFSLAFGPILIENGAIKETNDYPIGEIYDYFSRSALCQMDKLHYLVADANMDDDCYHAPMLREFGEILLTTGCHSAYTLDGGQTATIVMNNEVINNVNYGAERNISDIIYFATAIPEGGQ